MAATGTPTPNIGLRRAQGTDPASVDDINYNSALIDTKLGAVGNSSVQDQIDTLNGKSFTNDVKSGLTTLNDTSLIGYYPAVKNITGAPDATNYYEYSLQGRMQFATRINNGSVSDVLVRVYENGAWQNWCSMHTLCGTIAEETFSANEEKAKTINFTQTFASAPSLVLTPISSYGYCGQIHVSIKTISTTSATIQIKNNANTSIPIGCCWQAVL